MARTLALLVYPIVLLAGLAGRLLGRDPLRLKRPPPGSLWLARAEPRPSGYFSEASEVEGRGNGGFGRVAAGALLRLSRLWRRRSAAASAPRREGELPDEIYTLW